MYEGIVGTNWGYSNLVWQLIWKCQSRQRVHSFLWLAYRNCLLTNGERAGRGITDDACCNCCGELLEAILHVLHDCVYAKNVWNSLLTSNECWFFQLPLNEWIVKNIQEAFHLSFVGINWSSHSSTEELIPTNLLWAEVYIMLLYAQVRGRGAIHMGMSANANWEAPEEGWMKLSTDVAVDRSKWNAAIGGLF
ncbi:hypothetical protein J1N35_024509 [Gossypium stocksii]|uniref:Reverse transcriptase zinc-binding domain-containing protein n=1 Tax=Gossypium stocksii TaxID=47602 RepID=A0A9D3ZWT2_9ROSI|nr:hypothetical protein J1N35_024509 [Gossypium stocksii]